MTDNNYSELDKELARLKSELEIQDEMTSRFSMGGGGFSSSPNYWQRRLAEEQELWKKRLLTREEEKKALEARIKKQELSLEEYRQKLAEIEKTFERELKDREERFRLKEADLLLEKNRLLWEEKIKDAESETRQLLEKINALNETIARLKDENIADREKLQAQHAEEKRILDEKIASLESVIKKLEEHLSEVKSNSALEIEKLKNEIALRTEELEALSSARTELDARKNSLLKEIDALNNRLDEEKKIYEDTRRGLAVRALGIIEEKMGYLRRIAAYRERFGLAPAPKEVEIFLSDAREALERIFNGGNTPQGEEKSAESFKPIVVAIGDSDRLKSVLTAMERVSYRQCRLATWRKDISRIMPSAIITDSPVCAFSAARKYPFLPVLCFSEKNISVKSEKLPHNLRILSSQNPSSAVVALKEIEESALNSFARPENWQTLIPNKSILKNKFVGISLGGISGFILAIVIVVVAGVFVKVPTGGRLADISAGWGSSLVGGTVKEFSVPYSMPTAVTLDGGRYLWSCDWQGGAIYQHLIDNNLTLKKISYFPNQTFSALTYHAGALYSANPWNKKIYKHLINENFSVEKEYSSAGISIGAISFVPLPAALVSVGTNTLTLMEGKDTYVLLADAYSTRVIAGYLDDEKKSFVPLRDLSLVSSVKGGTIAGMWYDGKFLWVCETLSNYVYRYRPDDGFSPDGIYLLPESYRKNFKISGFTAGKSVGGDLRIWISSERMGKIISLPFSKLIKLENG